MAGKIREAHWKKWEVLGEPKNMGGLSFKDLEFFKKAMLAKQAWKLLQEPNSLVGNFRRRNIIKIANFYKLRSDLLLPLFGRVFDLQIKS